MSELIPPSAALLPAAPELRAKLAIALREVALLRRLIRVVEVARPVVADRVAVRPRLEQAHGAGADERPTMTTAELAAWEALKLAILDLQRRKQETA